MQGLQNSCLLFFLKRFTLFPDECPFFPEDTLLRMLTLSSHICLTLFPSSSEPGSLDGRRAESFWQGGARLPVLRLAAGHPAPEECHLGPLSFTPLSNKVVFLLGLPDTQVVTELQKGLVCGAHPTQVQVQLFVSLRPLLALFLHCHKTREPSCPPSSPEPSEALSVAQCRDPMRIWPYRSKLTPFRDIRHTRTGNQQMGTERRLS